MDLKEKYFGMKERINEALGNISLVGLNQRIQRLGISYGGATLGLGLIYAGAEFSDNSSLIFAGTAMIALDVLVDRLTEEPSLRIIKYVNQRRK